MNENPLQFPKKVDEPRLTDYDHYDKLYFGDHYSAFRIKSKTFNEQYSRLRYVVANFPGIISRVMADMLFGEPIVIEVKNENNQTWLDGLVEDNHLIAQLYESALGNSRRGDSLFKMRIGQPNNDPDEPSTVIIEEITPQIYFPVIDPSGGRNTVSEEVLAWTKPIKDSKEVYLVKETHSSGNIQTQVFRYNPDTKLIISEYTEEEVSGLGYKPQEDTKIKDTLLFHIPNVRDGSSYFGTSDYKDLEQLFFALNNRITKIDNILDKHSDPILAVPPGVFDKDGKVKKESFGMFEVDNENPGFNKPEYIVWNANLEAAFKQIDKLVEMLFTFSEIAPAAAGMDKDTGGQGESARAFKYKLLTTIRKRNRKKIYYDIVIKEMLETAQEFGKAWDIKIDNVSVETPEKPQIKWSEGIIPSVDEVIDMEIKRVEGGLSTRADAIVKLDGTSPDDAKDKVKEIDAENAILVPNLDKVVNVKNPVDKNPLSSGVPDIVPGDTKVPIPAPKGK